MLDGDFPPEGAVIIGGNGRAAVPIGSFTEFGELTVNVCAVVKSFVCCDVDP